ncbi:MAG: hypothetical protein A2Y72_03350 [Chloroflexi bacterium RBG_13_53_26]|nr:MAG: hypothetical protein A2Y72_03350 [Chloroflexi bacterium RBG_13_53_26]
MDNRDSYETLVSLLCDVFDGVNVQDIRTSAVGVKIFHMAADPRIPSDPVITSLLSKIMEMAFRLESYQQVLK